MEQQVNEMSINGVSYIRKDSVNKQEYSSDIKIVILQRGWVMVGRLERKGSECKLHNASVIRTWGTTKGLGELAENGKLKDTILDPCNGLVEFDYLTVVASIACKESAWAKEL